MVKNLGFSDLFSYWGNFLGKSTRGVGVELTGDRINIAQLHRVRQGLRIESLSTFPVPEGIMVNGEICDCPRMGEIISQAIVESKIKTTQIRTCIPEKHAIVRIIPAPLELEGQELYDSFINQEAGLYLPYPREEADIDCQKIGLFHRSRWDRKSTGSPSCHPEGNYGQLYSYFCSSWTENRGFRD